jgi:hypothetical protein
MEMGKRLRMDGREFKGKMGYKLRLGLGAGTPEQSVSSGKW